MATSMRVRGRGRRPAGESSQAADPEGSRPVAGAGEGEPPTRRRREGKTAVGFERLAHVATIATGSTTAFALAAGVIVLWVVTGPLFGFSDTWQLVINTGTTIVTFLMVFLIQRTQNKDSSAVQLKLNEIVAAMEGASNRLINVEDLSEQELEILHAYYGRLSRLAKEHGDLTASHSVGEAEENALSKRRRTRR